jgi:hypothetical protein
MQREELEGLVLKLRGLLSSVQEDGMYMLPWRVHDHEMMDEPDKWIGYAWVGADGERDGRFDRRVADLDARKDGSEKCRRTATLRARLIAETISALPTLLEAITQRPSVEEIAWAIVDPFATFGGNPPVWAIARARAIDALFSGRALTQEQEPEHDAG